MNGAPKPSPKRSGWGRGTLETRQCSMQCAGLGAVLFTQRYRKECSGSAVKLRHCPATVICTPPVSGFLGERAVKLARSCPRGV
jgi:hypothetical protein